MELEHMINKLTLEEKAALLQGWTTWSTREFPDLGIPAIFLSDGPHGLRKQAGAADHLGLNASVPATCFPTAATMANSWDASLGEELGEALGEEAAANDVNVVLGPGLNIKRSPLCGRNFEYFSEDPLLSGKMAAAYVRGIQKNGVSACPKHFAVNSQEEARMATDSVLDERTLRELYLTGFEIAVREGRPKTVMSSYNLVNGVYANENKHLITDILRNEWGFDGFVVTDWGGDNDHVSGVKAGSNLVMPAPGPGCAKELAEAVQSGSLDETVLDARLRELLPVIFSTAEALKCAPKRFDKDAHHDVARACAAASIVLLENDGILPLAKDRSVALIGDFAKTPRYQGAGSSVVNPTKLDDLWSCAEAAGLRLAGWAQGFSRTERQPQQNLIDEAVELAQKAETVLLCVGLDEISESEGLDRNTLSLSEGQNALIRAVCSANQNVVLVLSGGSPFVLPPVSCRAVIHGYLGGQAGAAAMADALTGRVNPSGRLAETWPLALEDCPATPFFPGKAGVAEYREGLFCGYRGFDTAELPVKYPFGHGLSYTSFAWSEFKADADRVSLRVKNTGKLDGAEVVQIYASKPDGKVLRPRRKLAGFAKVFLRTGEEKTVEIPLSETAFRHFDRATERWAMEPGLWTLEASRDLRNVCLRAEICLEGAETLVCAADQADAEQFCRGAVSNQSFRVQLGRELPAAARSGLIRVNEPLSALSRAKNPIARLVSKIMTNMIKKAEAKGKPDLNLLFVYNMPFRAIGKMSGGMVSGEMVEDIVFLVNGHWHRGLGRLIRDFFRTKKVNKAFCKALEEAPQRRI